MVRSNGWCLGGEDCEGACLGGASILKLGICPKAKPQDFSFLSIVAEPHASQFNLTCSCIALLFEYELLIVLMEHYLHLYSQ